MEYEGKLYGQLAGQYFPMLETTEDIDKMRKQNGEMIEVLQSIKEALEGGGDINKRSLPLGHSKTYLTMIKNVLKP